MLQRAAHGPLGALGARERTEHTTRTSHRGLGAPGARALGAGRWRRMQAPRVNTASCCAARSCGRQHARTRTDHGPSALRATSLAPATPNTFDYLRVSQSAQNIMCGDTFQRTVRQGDTGGSATRQSRLGRDTSVRGGAECARRAAAAHRRRRQPRRSDAQTQQTIRWPAPSISARYVPVFS